MKIYQILSLFGKSKQVMHGVDSRKESTLCNGDMSSVISEAISTHGYEILCDTKLFNILQDYNVFKEDSSIKYIVRIALAESIFMKIKDIPIWNEQCEQEVYRFGKRTGFNISKVRFVFQVFYKSMGNILNDVSITESVIPQSVPTEVPSLNVEIRDNWVEQTYVDIQDLKISYERHRFNIEVDLIANLKRCNRLIYSDFEDNAYYVSLILRDKEQMVRGKFVIDYGNVDSPDYLHIVNCFKVFNKYFGITNVELIAERGVWYEDTFGNYFKTNDCWCNCIPDTHNTQIIDISNMLQIEKLHNKLISQYQIEYVKNPPRWYNKESISVYIELSFKGYRDLNDSKLLIYDKQGKLKQSINLNLSFFTSSSLRHNAVFFNYFDSRLDLEDIGLIKLL